MSPAWRGGAWRRTGPTEITAIVARETELGPCDSLLKTQRKSHGLLLLGDRCNAEKDACNSGETVREEVQRHGPMRRRRRLLLRPRGVRGRVNAVIVPGHSTGRRNCSPVVTPDDVTVCPVTGRLAASRSNRLLIVLWCCLLCLFPSMYFRFRRSCNCKCSLKKSKYYFVIKGPCKFSDDGTFENIAEDFCNEALGLPRLV